MVLTGQQEIHPWQLPQLHYKVILIGGDHKLTVNLSVTAPNSQLQWASKSLYSYFIHLIALILARVIAFSLLLSAVALMSLHNHDI